MGLTCLWRRRQIARCLLISRPIDDDPGLKRHVQRCRGCAEALLDFECFDSALQPEHVVRLSPDFNSKLAARLAAVAANPANSLPPVRRGARLLKGPWPAIAIACTGGLILWICASRDRSSVQDAGKPGDQTVWIKPLPSHAPDSIFNLTRDIDPSPGVADGPLRGLEPAPPRWRTRRRPHRRRYIASARLVKGRGTHYGHWVQLSPADSESAGTAVGAKELFISLVTSPWRETAEAYAQIGDQPSARDAYAKEYERDGDVEAAIRAGEYSRASGDPASELQYCALALSANR
jgi:hypothetical protein